MIDSEPNNGPVVCPRCGDPAEYERDGPEVEVDCDACGRYSITLEELEEALEAWEEQNI